MSAALKPPPTPMTVAEFLQWEPDDGGLRWQLIDGEPVTTSPEGDDHGAMVCELGRLIANHLLERGSSWRAAIGPGIIPRVCADNNWRIPDIGVTSAPPRGTHDMPAAVLLADILSPADERVTRANIWAYTTVPSVQEILILHSTKIEAEHWRRQPDGIWPKQPTILHDGDALTLESINLTLPVRAPYRTTSLAA